MNKDRLIVGRMGGTEEHYLLDGMRHEVYDAVDYLVAQGFSEADARAYLRGLPRAGR